MTLLEVMLAVSITGVIGLGITAMMNALSSGMIDQHDARSSMLRAGLAQTRMSSYLARSRCLIDLEQHRLVVWLEDSDGNDVVDPDEVRWVSFDRTSGTLAISWIADPEGLLEEPYEDPAGIDWWLEFDRLEAIHGIQPASLVLVSGLSTWTFSDQPSSSDRQRRESAMASHVVHATYVIPLGSKDVTHCIGESIRMHQPPDGGSI